MNILMLLFHIVRDFFFFYFPIFFLGKETIKQQNITCIEADSNNNNNNYKNKRLNIQHLMHS